MEETRCIRCGRPLHDPESIARGMGPECAGASGSSGKSYRANVRSRSSSYDAAVGHGRTGTPTLFTLVEDSQYEAEQPLVDEILPREGAYMEQAVEKGY